MLKIQVLLSVILTTFLFVPVLAQSPQNETDEPIIKIDTNLVSFDVQVLNKKTNTPIKNLTINNFEVYEDNVKQEITNFSQDQLPLSVLLLIDVSGSTDPISYQIQEATTQALKQLKNADEVGLMAFGSGTGAIDLFTKDKQIVVDYLEPVRLKTRKLGQGTNFKGAINEVVSHMKKFGNPNYRKVVIVITDNIINPINDLDKNQIVTKLLESNITVSCLVVEDIDATSVLNNGGSLGANIFGDNINNFTDETGGEIFDARRTSISEKFVELVDHLRARYSVGYFSTNTKTDRKLRKIKINVISSDLEISKEDLVVKARRGYFVPKESKNK